MVTGEYSDSRAVVLTPEYREMVLELGSVLEMNVEETYEDFFIAFDTLKMKRARLERKQLLDAIAMDRPRIYAYTISKFTQLRDEVEEQEHPTDSEPEVDDKDEILSVDGYSQGFLLTNIIEYLLAKEGVERLRDYAIACKIPKPLEYANQVIALIKYNPLSVML
jgi:hypothetical protein